ncbi:MAG: PAS domain S-box protein [Deltaproteobacteria bacterium]|nr:PAS domain S-box protein [Deltaproteobacteria bacterium]
MKKRHRFQDLHLSLSFRLIFWVGLILAVSITAWAYYNIGHQKERAVENIVEVADRLGNTIRLGVHYAMMLNSRDDITQTIKNFGKQEGIKSIRIFNKAGETSYSSNAGKAEPMMNMKEGACLICHNTNPPLVKVSLAGRTRIFEGPQGERFLGIISPIYNQPGCASAACHFHPKKTKVLGALDVVVSLKDTDREIFAYERGIILMAVFIFLLTSGFMAFFLLRFVNRPIQKLIEGTRHIGRGEYGYQVDLKRKDDIGQLSDAINHMGKKIGEKQDELNKQKGEYQKLFESAPCYITVQDRDFKLLRYNREFAEQFDAHSGDYCYQVYKGRSERCDVCPVQDTFDDGQPHHSEEEGINRDGTKSCWMVRTSPVKNKAGEVVAAMEMSLDVTAMKHLESEVKKSEEKYKIIFSTIPNPVFVLDQTNLDILDCNDNVTSVYGYQKEEVLNTSFLNFFGPWERRQYESRMKASTAIDSVKHYAKDGRAIYVNIRVSSTEFSGEAVFLVTISDITERLLAEQQLIQASKMATLGEMSTGVAHELNQPLSVIKTAGSFLHKKALKGRKIDDDTMKTLTGEINSQVDRASKIINHMREFGRKSDVVKEEVQLNDALKRALEIFRQQLKLREIKVVLDLQPQLPSVMADSNRLEQVFINLLINARDAIEAKWWGNVDPKDKAKEITLKTRKKNGKAIVEIADTGTGIPKAIIDKIFEPFFTTKQVGKGTGLGLSISYGIVRDYDGTISVKSEEDKGSTFTIQFPLSGSAR